MYQKLKYAIILLLDEKEDSILIHTEGNFDKELLPFSMSDNTFIRNVSGSNHCYFSFKDDQEDKKPIKLHTESK